MENYEDITSGILMTESYFKINDIEDTNGFKTLYKLNRRVDLKYDDNGVRNIDGDDNNTKVYEVVDAVHHTGGSIDTMAQDPTSSSINYYFVRVIGTTNPSQSYNVGTNSIVVISATGAEVNNVVNIKTNHLFYQGIVKTIVGNTVTIFPEINFDIDTDTIIEFGDYNLNKNGSVTPLEYELEPPKDAKWDLYTMNFSIIDDTAMDDSKFGGATALTNGITCSKQNHDLKNFWLIFSNGGFEEQGFTIKYTDKAPANYYGLTGRKNIREINGVAVRIDGTSKMIIKVNDNLSSLNKLTFTINGHIVE